MRRALQVYLEDSEFEALRRWADQRGWTLSQAVRTALKPLTRSESDADPLLAASGMIDGLPKDSSARFDDYLAVTYVAEPPVRYEQKTRRRPSRKPVRR